MLLTSDWKGKNLTCPYFHLCAAVRAARLQPVMELKKSISTLMAWEPPRQKSMSTLQLVSRLYQGIYHWCFQQDVGFQGVFQMPDIFLYIKEKSCLPSAIVVFWNELTRLKSLWAIDGGISNKCKFTYIPVVNRFSCIFYSVIISIISLSSWLALTILGSVWSLSSRWCYYSLFLPVTWHLLWLFRGPAINAVIIRVCQQYE